MDPKTDIPEIEVIFTNGIKQKMVLEHYNIFPNSAFIDQSRVCNYLGYLEGDKSESNVAVTGCLMGEYPEEMMHISLLSKHSPLHKTFSIDKEGNVNHVETPFLRDGSHISDSKKYSSRKTPSLRSSDRSDWRAEGDDALINELLEVAASNVPNAERDTVPNTLTINLRLGYDREVKRYFENNRKHVNDTPENFLTKVMTHVQNDFYHVSLQHKIIFKVLDLYLILKVNYIFPNTNLEIIE